MLVWGRRCTTKLCADSASQCEAARRRNEERTPRKPSRCDCTAAGLRAPDFHAPSPGPQQSDLESGVVVAHARQEPAGVNRRRLTGGPPTPLAPLRPPRRGTVRLRASLRCDRKEAPLERNGGQRRSRQEAHALSRRRPPTASRERSRAASPTLEEGEAERRGRGRAGSASERVRGVFGQWPSLVGAGSRSIKLESVKQCGGREAGGSELGHWRARRWETSAAGARRAAQPPRLELLRVQQQVHTRPRVLPCGMSHPAHILPARPAGTAPPSSSGSPRPPGSSSHATAVLNEAAGHLSLRDNGLSPHAPIASSSRCDVALPPAPADALADAASASRHQQQQQKKKRGRKRLAEPLDDIKGERCRLPS